MHRAATSKTEKKDEAVQNLVNAAEACRNVVADSKNRFLLQWLTAAIEAVKEHHP